MSNHLPAVCVSYLYMLFFVLFFIFFDSNEEADLELTWYYNGRSSITCQSSLQGLRAAPGQAHVKLQPSTEGTLRRAEQCAQ